VTIRGSSPVEEDTDMKEIKAVIRPFKLLDVIAELRKIPPCRG
jgi:hypothetical protein